MVPGKSPAQASGLAGLLEQHREELRRFIAARCGDPAEAEDLLQNLWFKTLRQPAGPIANGRAYLFRMANNLVLDAERMRRRAMARDHNWLVEEGNHLGAPDKRADPSVGADEVIARDQELELLRRAVAALPPGAREALRLFRMEGKPQAEIAELMGISRSGVEKHLALAMRHLRKSLSECGLFEPAASGKHHAHASDETPLGPKP